MNVLITGCAGFIGFHLAKTLLDREMYVIGFDNFLSGQQSNIEELQSYPKFIFKEIDVTCDLNQLLDILNKLDFTISEIYHLACPASPQIYQIDQKQTLDICYLGTKNMLEIALKYGSKIFLASTSECYGDPKQHPQTESYWGNVNTFGPRACYDEGKRVLETLGYIYINLGVNIKIARIFNTYGPNMNSRDGRVIGNFIRQAINKEPLTIYGDGTQTRSFCYISDLLKGILALMVSDYKQPINLGNNKEHSIQELAKIVADICEVEFHVLYKKLPADDPKTRQPNISLAKNILGWSPCVSIHDGIKKVASYVINSSLPKAIRIK